MSANLANYAETAVVDWLMGGATPSRPSARYVALHTGDPTDSGSSNELSGYGYARQAATFAAASSGASSTTGAITFTAAGGNWGAIGYCSIWDASTSGNCLWQGACTSKTINDGDSYQFAAGALAVSID